jgi:predicted nucleic-acid-binding protein
MIGLDTNVLVRYIMQDDPKQSAKATKLIESLDGDSPGFVSIVSVIELYWVLTSCYALSNLQVKQALEVPNKSWSIELTRWCGHSGSLLTASRTLRIA